MKRYDYYLNKNKFINKVKKEGLNDHHKILA